MDINRKISVILICILLALTSSCKPTIYSINKMHSLEINYAYNNSKNEIFFKHAKGWGVDSISNAKNIKVITNNKVEFDLPAYVRNKKYYVFLSKNRKKVKIEFLSGEIPRFESVMPWTFEKDTIQLYDLFLSKFTCGNKAYSRESCDCLVKGFYISVKDSSIYNDSDKFTNQNISYIVRNVKSFSIDSILMSSYCSSQKIYKKNVEKLEKTIIIKPLRDSLDCIENLNLISFSANSIEKSRNEIEINKSTAYCDVLFFYDLGSSSDVEIFDSKGVISKFHVKAGFFTSDNLFNLKGYSELKLVISGDVDWKGTLVLH